MKLFKYYTLLMTIVFSNAALADNIEGVWDGTCKGDYRWYIQFGGEGNFRQSLELMSSDECSSHDLEDYRDGPYSVSYDQNGDLTLTWRIDEYYRVLKAEYLVRIYNANGYCGFTDWELDLPKEITDIDCGGSSNVPTEFSMIEGSIDGDTLFLGRTNSGEPAPWMRRD